MAPYTARTGGVFGSGLYANSRPQVDVGGAIDSVTRGATSLIQNAYERRLADQQRQIQADERARQHSREDVLDQRAADDHRMRVDEHDATMAASGYTPAHQETTTAVEAGSVKSDGLFGGKGSITGPSIKEKTSTVRGAYDYRKSAAYQISSDTRTRKALEFAGVYKKNFPNATDEEANQAGLYAADNPSIADNILFPPRDPTQTHATNRLFDNSHPSSSQRAGSASSPIGKALSTAQQRVNRNARDRTQGQTRFRQMHPGVNSLEDAGTKQDSSDFRRFQSADSTLAAEGGRLKATQDSLATRQLRESGLTPKTDSTNATKRTPAPAAGASAEEKRLRALAKNAIDNGADPAAVTQRLNQQLSALRTKK